MSNKITKEEFDKYLKYVSLYLIGGVGSFIGLVIGRALSSLPGTQFVPSLKFFIIRILAYPFAILVDLFISKNIIDGVFQIVLAVVVILIMKKAYKAVEIKPYMKGLN